MRSLWPVSVADSVRSSDIKGALTVGELPYLQHRRLHSNVSDVLPLTFRRRITRIVEHMLVPCGIQSIVIDSVAGLAIFASTVCAATAPGSTIRLDPHGFIDEWYWVQHQLLQYPGPLSNPDTPAQSLQVTMSAEASHGVAIKGNEPLIKTVYMPSAQSVEPARASNILEPIVRLASILYIEALVPDDPRTLNGYAVLLTLMSKLFGDVMRRIRHLNEQGEKDEPIDELPEVAVMRPVMIWASLVAYVVAWLGDKEVHWGAVRYDRDAYRECLVYFVGSRPEDVDLLIEGDLELCQLMGMKDLIGNKMDTRVLLKAVIKSVDGGLRV